MRIVEHNDDSSGKIIDGLDPNYGEYGNILDILDFPLESFKLDDTSTDWDASNSQDLGPIPLDAFMGFYQSHVDNESMNKPPCGTRNALIRVESQQKEQVDFVVTNSNTTYRNGASTSRQIAISPETSAFQTPSPISVLESSGTCSCGKSLPIKFEMAIPVRARSKRGRPSNVNKWFLKTPIACTGSVAKKSSTSTKAKKRPRASEFSNSPEGLSGSFQQAMKRLPDDLNHTKKDVASMQLSVRTRRCSHCNVTKTPQWREGPLGKNTLCNACGVRYRSGRLFPEYRPAASPTFTPSLHSNSHRKVTEMRKNAIEEAVLVENPMSSLAEFVPMSNLFNESMSKKW
ncbi:zinc finger transcription factor [Lithospermum erythrorhizon]|uniref:Zinc finger transcription factor n=1 Tax=Lithospermum erythrorhizon TaxID=34254 RepID=A0AAV3RBH7_LITER